MLRRIGLSIGLLISMVVILPLATSTAHNLRSQFMTVSHHHRRHSRAWWRRHRALMRRRQALIARRRALIAARNGMAIAKAAENHASQPPVASVTDRLYRDGTFAISLPTGWSAETTKNGISNFRIATGNASGEAQATLAVVTTGPTPNQIYARQQRNALAGVSYSDLRRTVIDKMITAGGWVVNDRQRDVGGQRVFEVIAQTPAANGNPDQVWNFFFTDVNGRVYSLTTHTGETANGRVTSDAEKFLATFHSANVARAK